MNIYKFIFCFIVVQSFQPSILGRWKLEEIYNHGKCVFNRSDSSKAIVGYYQDQKAMRDRDLLHIGIDQPEVSYRKYAETMQLATMEFGNDQSLIIHLPFTKSATSDTVRFRLLNLYNLIIDDHSTSDTMHIQLTENRLTILADLGMSFVYRRSK